ncbi:MAG: DNA-binding protein [Spirochaetes bacterium]|nr:DNA-binding protein [Spirochaetota bacterium]
MNYVKFNNYYILRIDKNEEIIETLKNFCKKNQIKLGFITGIGAVNNAVIGLFNTDNKEFIKKEFSGAFEITALNGNISQMNDEVYLHVHVTIADDKFNNYGGHFSSGIVSGTCEIVITEIEGKVDRKFNSDIGLNLFEF